MASQQTEIGNWIQIVRAEFMEMPGLHLTKPQVRRLWGLDAATCDTLLQQLEMMKILRRTASNDYVKADVEH